MCKADGKAVIAGVVAGFETQIRLSLALNPSDHYERGFHPTATCGVFGAAAAAAVVLGLDSARCLVPVALTSRRWSSRRWETHLRSDDETRLASSASGAPGVPSEETGASAANTSIRCIRNKRTSFCTRSA